MMFSSSVENIEMDSEKTVGMDCKNVARDSGKKAGMVKSAGTVMEKAEVVL